jgi:transposase
MNKKKKHAGGGRELATAYKLLVVQERMKGTSEKDVAAAFGVSTAAVAKWTNATNARIAPVSHRAVSQL